MELVELRKQSAELSKVEHKQAEERTRHINTVLCEIYTVNQLIAREKDRDKLVKGVFKSLIDIPVAVIMPGSPS